MNAPKFFFSVVSTFHPHGDGILAAPKCCYPDGLGHFLKQQCDHFEEMIKKNTSFFFQIYISV